MKTINKILFVFALCLAFGMNVNGQVACGAGDAGFYVNEVGQGAAGNEEWIELVAVTDAGSTLSLDGWVINDNDGAIGTSGVAAGYIYFTLSNDPSCSALASIPAGSLVIVYNSAEVDSNLPAADPFDADNDGVYVIPDTNVCLDGCNSDTYPCPLADDIIPNFASDVQFANTNDGALVYNGTSLFHGIGWGSNSTDAATNTLTAGVGAGGSGNRAYAFGCGDATDGANFTTITDAASATPGTANDVANTAFIDNLTGGTFDCADFANNCVAEPVCGISDVVAAAPVCAADNLTFDVVITFTGTDDSVLFNGGTNTSSGQFQETIIGSATYTYNAGETYNIVVEDPDGLCSFGPFTGTESCTDAPCDANITEFPANPAGN